MKKVGVAILGLGVVGGGAYRILTQNREFYRNTQAVDLFVESVLETNAARLNELGIPEELSCSNIAEIVSDPDVNIVVECIGDVERAREYALAALNAGKTVVTSDAELYSKYSHELERAAKRHNAGLFFGASCVGGVPAVRTLLDGVQSNAISSVIAVVNGTANDFFTRMENGAGHAQALQEALSGREEVGAFSEKLSLDAAYQLSILSSLAFHTKIPFTKVTREGIEGISAEDAADAAALGYTLKYLAVGKRSREGIEVRVHPAFVKKTHPLSDVRGTNNAVCLSGDWGGELLLSGEGGGELSSGSSVVSDILYAATHTELRYSPFKNTTAAAEKDVKFVTDFRGAYYLRLTISDGTGTLAKLASVFARSGISFDRIVRRDGGAEEGRATLAIVTRETHEQALKTAVSKLAAMDLGRAGSVLRVVR